MKRINGMIEILTDPERRRAYNDSLDSGALIVRQKQLTAWVAWVRGNRGWALVGMTFVLLLISPLLAPMFDSARSAHEAHEPLTATSASSRRTPEKQELASHPNSFAGPGMSNLIRRSAGDWKRASGSPDPREDARKSSAALANPISGAVVAAPAPESTSASPTAEPPTAQSSPSAARPAPALAGKWVYTPDPSDPGDPKLYPAEYVELSIAPLGNVVRGVYQARYRLPGHTLNSRVDFTFEGPSTGTSFAWQGDSGAQGEIAIRLESTDTLKVNWFATKMGSALSLGSGKATLYRFR